MGLVELLDRLEAEILGASAEELHAALCETGRAREGALCELRSLLRAAEANEDDQNAGATPSEPASSLGVHRH